MDYLGAYRRTGDSRIAARIFQQYWHLVLGSAIKLLGEREAAQDAAMDIFQKVLERLRVETPDYFSSWLYAVTRNHCLELLRRQQKQPDFESLDGVRIPVQPENEMVEDRENQALVALHVHKALAALPDHQRLCVVMFYMQDLSYKEISEESGYSLKMVKSFIQNGKRRLTLLLGALRGSHLSDQAAI